MSNLISIQDNDGVQAVMGRDLHAFLEVRERYTQWVARHVEKYGFIAGQGFIREIGKSTGGRPSENHILTMDMAKELSMIQANSRGKQARQYFIECEKRAKAAAPALPQTYKEALVALVAELEARVEMVRNGGSL